MVRHSKRDSAGPCMAQCCLSGIVHECVEVLICRCTCVCIRAYMCSVCVCARTCKCANMSMHA